MSLISYWQKALESEIGICINTDDRQLLRMQLYRTRADSGNPDYEGLVIIFPEKDEELWIVHSNADANIGRTAEEDYIKPL